MALATKTALATTAQTIRNFKGEVSWALRDALVLTTAYVASAWMPCDDSASVGIFITFAGVDYTSIDVLMEGSYDGTNWFKIIPRRYATAYLLTLTLATVAESATDDGIHLDVVTPAALRWVRVKVKRTGGSAIGTVAILGVQGGQV